MSTAGEVVDAAAAIAAVEVVVDALTACEGSEATPVTAKGSSRRSRVFAALGESRSSLESLETPRSLSSICHRQLVAVERR